MSNNSKSDFIKETSIEDNILKGLIHLPALKSDLQLEIDPEIDSSDPAGFNKLIKKSQKLIEYLIPENLLKLKQSVAKEIAESAYEQEEYEPTANDLGSLVQNLSLEKIVSFPDGFTLSYRADNIFPDNEIIVQLDRKFRIDDIAIYD